MALDNTELILGGFNSAGKSLNEYADRQRVETEKNKPISPAQKYLLKMLMGHHDPQEAATLAKLEAGGHLPGDNSPAQDAPQPATPAQDFVGPPAPAGLGGNTGFVGPPSPPGLSGAGASPPPPQPQPGLGAQQMPNSPLARAQMVAAQHQRGGLGSPDGLENFRTNEDYQQALQVAPMLARQDKGLSFEQVLLRDALKGQNTQEVVAQKSGAADERQRKKLEEMRREHDNLYKFKSEELNRRGANLDKMIASLERRAGAKAASSTSLQLLKVQANYVKEDMAEVARIATSITTMADNPKALEELRAAQDRLQQHLEVAHIAVANAEKDHPEEPKPAPQAAKSAPSGSDLNRSLFIK